MLAGEEDAEPSWRHRVNDAHIDLARYVLAATA